MPVGPSSPVFVHTPFADIWQKGEDITDVKDCCSITFHGNITHLNILFHWPKNKKNGLSAYPIITVNILPKQLFMLPSTLLCLATAGI